MKLVRYGAIGQERPGLIDKSGQLRDLSAHVKDLNGEAYSPASLAKLAALDPTSLPAVSGPHDAVEKPRGSTKLDWEVEIAAIIGTSAKYVSEANALNHVAGYCVCNDVSERNFQIERLGQWTKGKSHDTFGPVGPWLVTK